MESEKVIETLKKQVTEISQLQRDNLQNYLNQENILLARIKALEELKTTPTLTAEEIEKIIAEKLGLNRVEDLLIYNVWKQSIKEIAHALSPKIAKEVEGKCCCGEPLTLGVVHNKYTPCYFPSEEQKPKPQEPEGCKHDGDKIGGFGVPTICCKCGKELFSLPQPAEKEQSKCGICGGKLAEIRGRFPGTESRKVCPDCCASRLDQISEIADKDYGRCYTENS